MLTPLTPPPITTTSAVRVMAGLASAQERPRRGEARLGGRLQHEDGVVEAQVENLPQAPGRRLRRAAQMEGRAVRERLGWCGEIHRDVGHDRALAAGRAIAP